MLARCHVLMAQLLSVRLLMLRRRHQLDPVECEVALAAARADAKVALDAVADAAASVGPAHVQRAEKAAPVDQPSIAAPGAIAVADLATEPPVTVHATPANAAPGEDVDHAALPALLPDSAVMPWLLRRLHLATRAAQRVGLAAHALREVSK
jgi:hypothetical protein